MSLLRVAVFGPPEVFHDESRLTFSLRKAQALLLYLAVAKGLHPRSKLAAFLWPDSETPTAYSALRNALVLLHSLLDATPVEHYPLLIQQDALGLNPQAQLELDLERWCSRPGKRSCGSPQSLLSRSALPLLPRSSMPSR